MDQEFKRINFFKGAFLDAEDWNNFQAYHVNKRRLHNAALYTCGIIPGYLNSFTCQLKETDETRIQIHPGCAFDAEGKEILLSKPMDIKAIPENLHTPTTVYIVLKYQEEKIDHRRNGANTAYSGYAYTQESAHIEASPDKPDGQRSFEIARYQISKPEQQITNNDITESFQIFARPVYLGINSMSDVNLEPPKPGEQYSREIPLAVVRDLEPSRCYVATVQPTALLAEAQKVRCQWEIQIEYTLGEDGKRWVHYLLCIKNLSQVTIKATVQYCRIF